MEAVESSAPPAEETTRSSADGASPIAPAWLAWVPFTVLAWGFFAHTTDDTFIPMRYAWNLLHGHGPVFNIGERVEGFTSPLHVVVSMVVVLSPGGFALLKTKLVSLAFAALAVGWGVRLVRSVPLPPWAAHVATVMVGASLPIAFNAANGLETTLAAFCVTGLVVELVRHGATRPWIGAAWASAAALTRPEAVLIVVALALSCLVLERALPWWRRVAWAVGAGTVVGLVALGRFAYFGSVLPNTFHAKRQSPRYVLQQGSDYLAGALQPGAATIHPATGGAVPRTALVVVVTLLVSGAVHIVLRRPRLVVVLVPILCQVVFVVVAGGDWMPGARFLAPVALLIVLVQLFGVVEITSLLERLGTGAVPARAAMCAVLAVLALVGIAHTNRHPASWSIEGGLQDGNLLANGGYGRDWVRAPEYLQCARPGDLVMASEMGYGPWVRRDLRFIDARGLTNREIATGSRRLDRHSWGVADPDWRDERNITVEVALRRRPTVIVTSTLEAPTSFGGGLYTTEGILQPVDGPTVYRRSDVHCGRSVRRG